jgi:hypothetical protein
MLSPTPTAPIRTLGQQLDLVRLAHRAHRLERVLVALRARADDYSAAAIPPALRRAIRDFDRELMSVRELLR